MKSELEDSMDTTAAAQDLRQKREVEVTELKKQLEEAARAHDVQLQDLRHKHTQQLEQVNEQLDQTKKVASYLCILFKDEYYSYSNCMYFPQVVKVGIMVIRLMSEKYIHHQQMPLFCGMSCIGYPSDIISLLKWRLSCLRQSSLAYCSYLLHKYQPAETLQSSSVHLLHQPSTSTSFALHSCSVAAPAV